MVDETKIDGIPVYEIYNNHSLQNMTGEEWKDIEGYEGLYMVSNYGRVKSLGNGNSRNSKHSIETIMNLYIDKDGYIYIILCKNGKGSTKRVHRLVAIAYIKNTYNKPQINHISETLYDDENKDLAKKDNRVVNLEWCDNKYNSNYGTRNERLRKNQLNRKDLSKKVICVETNIVYPSAMEVQRKTGISNSSIIQCCKGKLKSAGDYHWKYTN